jgi:hypothetical protein
MEIKHYDTIPHTPALHLAVRAWAELLELGHISEAGVAVGELAWANEIGACLSYVLPERRRQGVQTAMWRALVAKAAELKRPVISASIAFATLASRAAMAANGGEEVAVVTRFRVQAL